MREGGGRLGLCPKPQQGTEFPAPSDSLRGGFNLFFFMYRYAIHVGIDDLNRREAEMGV
mgnify:CR=1 FL=1